MTARRRMTLDERSMARALNAPGVRLGTPHRRFARDLAAIADNSAEITNLQATTLCALVKRYRRQLHANTVALAEQHLKSSVPGERP